MEMEEVLQDFPPGTKLTCVTGTPRICHSLSSEMEPKAGCMEIQNKRQQTIQTDQI